MTADYDEGFPLAVVPMLALGDSWLGDVDAHLATVEGVEEFGETASCVHVHLEAIDGLLLGEVREIGSHEFVAEAALREVNHVDAVLVGCCFGTLVDNVHDFAKGGIVGDWTVAVQVVF